MYRGMNGVWGNGAMPVFGTWGGIISTLLILAALAIAIGALIRAGKSRLVPHLTPVERGLEILIERFAKGEIDAETFRSLKAELQPAGTTNS